MFKKYSLVVLGLSLCFSLTIPKSEAGRMRSSCYQYAYETVLDILTRDLSTTSSRYEHNVSQAKELAFNVAGDSCRREVTEKCLEYAFDRVQKVYRRPTREDRWKAWGEAVNACRKKVDAKCLEFAETFWKGTDRGRDPYRAFQNAVVSCDDDVRIDCLEYVMNGEMKRGRSSMAAFGAGVNACRGGTRKSCIELIAETISPDARPHARKHWEDAISICLRK